MRQNIYRYVTVKNMGWLYLITAIAASLHRYILGMGHYNNFLIFKNSFLHLLHKQNLYVEYAYQHFDLFKYSPSFAFFMMPFYYMPDWLGLVLWNTLNAMVFYFAVKKLPLTDALKVFVLLFCFIEQLTSIQNSQSNALLAGLMLLSFTAFENQKGIQSSVYLAVAFFIKLFGAATGLCFMFYKKKGVFLLSAVMITLLLFALPFFISGKDFVLQQYANWFSLLANDPSHELNYSFKTFWETVFGLQLNQTYLLIFGMVFLLLPLVNAKQFANQDYRLLYVCSVMMWTVIFNHKAESPTFVIAVAAMAIIFSHQYNNRVWLVLMIAAFVLTSLSSTDLFPKFIREEFIKPYRLKALASISMWLYIQVVFLAALFSGSKVDLKSPLLISVSDK